MRIKTNVFRLWLALLLFAISPTIGFADDVTFTATRTNVEGMNANENYQKAFDGSNWNKWCGNIDDGVPVWVEFHSSAIIKLTSYYFVTGNDVARNGQNRNPKSWKLYAKKKQSDAWSLISVVDDGNLPYKPMVTSGNYAVDEGATDKLYQYFKYEFSSIGNNNGNVFEIGEIRFNYTVYTQIFGDEEVAGEEETEWGKRSGRVKDVAPVTINGCTYTLYQDYTYKVYTDTEKANCGLEYTRDELSCVVTSSTATGALTLPSSVEFEIKGTPTPVKVAVVGEKAFYNSLTELTVPSSVEVVECCGITDRLNDDDTKEAKLTELNIEKDSSPLSIYQPYADQSECGVFSFSTALSHVFIGRTLVSLDASSTKRGLFEGNTSGMSVVSDGYVETLPARMFYGSGLRELTLPASLTKIPESLCENCVNLREIVIPSKVTSIGANAFAGCTAMEKYTLQESTPPTVGTGALSGRDNFTIATPNAPVGLYLKDGSAWMAYEANFVKPVIAHGVRHAKSNPTSSSTLGYTRECWEDLDTHKFYSDKYYSIEIDPNYVVVYPSFEKNRFNWVGCDDYSRNDYESIYLHQGIITEYRDSKDTHTASIDYYVKRKDVANARLLWYKDRNHADSDWGRFNIKVLVNGAVVYSLEQQVSQDVCGLFNVPLPDLKTGDVVHFQVDKPQYANWYTEGTIVFCACLDYTCSEEEEEIFPITLTPDSKKKIKEADGTIHPDPEFTWRVTEGNLLPGESLEGITISRVAGENAGDYTINLSQTQGLNPHYTISLAPGTLTILNGIKHEQGECTNTQVGYTETIWEVPSLGKYYADVYTAKEVDPLYYIRYSKLDISPVLKMTEGYTIKEEKAIEDEYTFYHAASSEFHKKDGRCSRKAYFTVNHNGAKNARLIWHRDEGRHEAGIHSVKISVNGKEVYSLPQGPGQNMYVGLYALDLGDLNAQDFVCFEVDCDATNVRYDFGVTFTVSLEYLPTGSQSPTLQMDVTANENPDEPGTYYTTFFHETERFLMPDYATAYTASIKDKNTLLLTPIEGSIIPPGEGVVIKTKAADLKLASTNFSPPKNKDNMFRGTNDSNRYAPPYCYILSYGQNGLGFYKCDQIRLTAYKAYLVYNPSAGVQALRMEFADDEKAEVDGIEAIGDDSAHSTSGIYSLTGVRQNKLLKGINIVNGKKIFVK